MADKKNKDYSLLVVTGSLANGGCETHLLQILPRLAKDGVDVSIFLISEPGLHASKMAESGVKVIAPLISNKNGSDKVIFIRLLRLIIVSIQLAFYCLFKRPDIAHFFLPASYWVGAPVAFITGIRHKVMSRRSLNNYMKGRKLFLTIERFLHKRMDAILGNSKAVTTQLIREEDAPGDRVGLIYNGVEEINVPPNAATELRSELKIKPDETLISVVANLIPYKGHADLLNAMKMVKESGLQNWRLILAGRDDGYGDKLRALCKEHGIAEQVTFLGSCDRVPTLLAASDLFVLPSHEEGFSNALLEAMQTGLPIVATNVGGNSEALDNGNAGLLVPPRSPSDLAHAIERLLRSREERQDFSQKSMQRARENYAMDACVTHYRNLYGALRSNQAVGTLSSFRINQKP